ncbi:MAG: hypothetical protein KC464_21825, partial [Myxococcales bacterium]|nr:hypothetical protein [Myxococcales bacterium]
TVVSDGQNGGASLLHRAVAGGAWSTDALADPSLGIAGAAVALVGGQPEVAVAVMDPATLDVAYRVLSPGGAHEVLAEACSPRPVRLLDDPAGTVVVYTCAGRVHVARRAVGGAWQEHATVEQMPLVAAIDGAGDVHLLGGTIAGGPTHRIVHDGAVEAAPLPAEVYAVEDAVACGGVVHATFDVSTGDAADARAVALGRLIDGAWQLEPVETQRAGGAVLGFDEACHPFVAIGDQVWARDRDGWVDTRIGFDSESVRALLGRGGTLFAAYTVLKDSQRAGIATATLRLE